MMQGCRIVKFVHYLKRKTIFVAWFAVLSLQIYGQRTAVVGLQCENKENPLLVDNGAPAFSWQLNDEPRRDKSKISPDTSYRNVEQAAYRVIVADDPSILRRDIGNIWDSQKVLSDQSIQLIYPGPKLQAAKRYWWKVKVWDNHGNESDWSNDAWWQMGLLETADWGGARWIGYGILPDSLRVVPAVSVNSKDRLKGQKDVLPLLRKQFNVSRRIKSATVFICGLGQFELHLNGKKVGDHFMDPGWTNFDKHALYVAFDVTGLLGSGLNTLGVMLGNGFYFIPGERYRKMSGAYGYPKMICRLSITYQNGVTEDIVSDSSWKTSAGPVTFSSIYSGEDYDARRDQPGWDNSHFADRSWKPALLVDGPPALEAQIAEPLKVFETFSPIRVGSPKAGIWMYDLGQNASGIPYIEVEGKPGDVVRITPSELVGGDGMAMQKWIGGPVNFSYTLRGGGREKWCPRFMYYGFRYLQLEGGVPKGMPNPDHLPVLDVVEGRHTRNAAFRVGSFSCSNDLFNKTFQLIDWAIQNNMASVFTDCPHREKLGWLEEAHLVGPSIRYNFDIYNLLRKVIRDIIKSQTSDGLIPDIAPEYTQFENGFRDSPEWGSSGILLPWYVYNWYGDSATLAESYDMMKRYAEYLEKKTAGHILSYGLGDWFDVGPRPPGESQLTPKGVTATAMYYYDLGVLARVASLLGKDADAQLYKGRASEVKRAFNDLFWHPDTKQYATGSQTANAMAVYMGLVDSADKDAVVDNIVRDIRRHNNSLSAGDIGYFYLLQVLDDAGRADVIYDMNSGWDRPGYGYQLAHGATALTESWQAFRDVSNDHMMLGHLMEWFYKGVAGIRPAANSVAFKDVEIRPEPVGDLTAANASFESPYGLIDCRWRKDSSGFHLIVKIPANCRATIYLPCGPEDSVFESGQILKDDTSIHFEGFNGGYAFCRVGSGEYKFDVLK